MKIIAPLTLASVLLVSACASSPQRQQSAQTPASASASASSSMQNYRCESGATIAATYPSTDSATIQYKGNSYSMQIAVSGSGSRYVGGGFEWWTKGSEGTLFRHNADGTSGDSIEVCAAS